MILQWCQRKINDPQKFTHVTIQTEMMSQVLSLLLLKRVRKTILRILLITALQTGFSTIYPKHDRAL